MDTSREDIFTAIHSPNPLEETMERVVGAIKARLLSPGDRLPPERELAQQLGVSRSTLRVALQNLIEAGWLEVRRGRHGGSFVARWPRMPNPRKLPEILIQYRDELPALLDYRRAVETTAAACAAERATDQEIEDLLELNTFLKKNERNFEMYRATDARFHIGIARSAHSPRIMEAVTEVQAAMTEVLDVIIFHSKDVLRNSTDYHWSIIEAIRQRDSEAAHRHMQDHLMATENVIYGLVPELGRQAEPENAQEFEHAALGNQELTHSAQAE